MIGQTLLDWGDPVHLTKDRLLSTFRRQACASSTQCTWRFCSARNCGEGPIPASHGGCDGGRAI